MTPDHGELLYEGKAKRVFASKDSDQVLVEFKNDATAFNAQKKAQLADKGRLNCQISARLFELLETYVLFILYLQFEVRLSAAVALHSKRAIWFSIL